MAANSFIPFDEGWKAIKAKTSKFLENIEGGMTKDTYKIPAKEFVAIYKCVPRFFIHSSLVCYAREVCDRGPAIMRL